MQGRYSSAIRGQKRPLAREPSTWRTADPIWNVCGSQRAQGPSEWLWETCWQLWPAVRKETVLKMKANKFPICIFLCSPPASAQPEVNHFSRQRLKAEAFVFSIALVNDFAWQESMMQGQDLTAAVLAATDSLFNLILFYISSFLSVYWPME